MILVSLPLFALLSLPQPARSSVAYCNNLDYELGVLGISPYQTYNAAPYHPVQINYALPPESGDCPNNSQIKGYFFFTPSGSVKMNGGVIMNPNGTLVYSAADLSLGDAILRGPMSYQGEDHLVFWVSDGTLAVEGYGSGYNILLNSSYDIVQNITTSNLTVGADVHELQITSNNTAVMTAYVSEPADLRLFGGPQEGYIVSCIAQEVDIATGEALFTWNSLDHVSPSECYAPIGILYTGNGTIDDPWDYFHINSVQKNEDGTYLISSRHCSTLYLVDSAGDIIWRMGGKNSDFTMNEGANFSWQHHARTHGSGIISVFDDGASQWQINASYSQGLLLGYDDSLMSVSLLSARAPFNRTITQSQGDVQILPNGNSVVGWGSMPYISEHSANGSIIWSAQFAASNLIAAYRVFLQPWVGRPRSPPSMSIANTSTMGNVTIYAYWNGATEVTAWRLLGSSFESPLKTTSIETVSKTDFETILISTNSGYTYYQVVALNAHGQTLGFSNLTALDGTTFGKAENQTVTAPPLR